MVREGVGKGGSPKGNFRQPSPGANIKFGLPELHISKNGWFRGFKDCKVSGLLEQGK